VRSYVACDRRREWVHDAAALHLCLHSSLPLPRPHAQPPMLLRARGSIGVGLVCPSPPIQLPLLAAACHAPQELKRRSPRLLISVSPYRDTWRAIYRPLLTGKYGRHVDTVLFQAYAYQDVSSRGGAGGGAGGSRRFAGQPSGACMRHSWHACTAAGLVRTLLEVAAACSQQACACCRPPCAAIWCVCVCVCVYGFVQYLTETTTMIEMYRKLAQDAGGWAKLTYGANTSGGFVGG
jgi:hypothetical protein